MQRENLPAPNLFDGKRMTLKSPPKHQDKFHQLINLKSSLMCTLFEWSRAWGFTRYTFAIEFC